MSRGLRRRRRLKQLPAAPAGGDGWGGEEGGHGGKGTAPKDLHRDWWPAPYLNELHFITYFTFNATRHICRFVRLPATRKITQTRQGLLRCSPVDVDKLLSHGQGAGVQVKYGGLQRLKWRGTAVRAGVSGHETTGTRTWQNFVYKTQCPLSVWPCTVWLLWFTPPWVLDIFSSSALHGAVSTPNKQLNGSVASLQGDNDWTFFYSTSK